MKKLIWRSYHFFNPYQKICYYDPRRKEFCVTKFSQDNGIVCTGFSRWYDDAHTNIDRQVLSYEFLWRCKRVGAIDKFPFAELARVTEGMKAYKAKQ